MHQKKAKLLNLKKLKNYLYSNPWPTEGLRKGLNIKTGVKRENCENILDKKYIDHILTFS